MCVPLCQSRAASKCVRRRCARTTACRQAHSSAHSNAPKSQVAKASKKQVAKVKVSKHVPLCAKTCAPLFQRHSARRAARALEGGNGEEVMSLRLGIRRR